MNLTRKAYLLITIFCACGLLTATSYSSKSPTLNLSSEENLLQSVQAISRSLTEEENRDFLVALPVLSFGSIHTFMQDPIAPLFNSSVPKQEDIKRVLERFLPLLKKARVEGKTAQEIIAKANQQLDINIKHYQERAKKEVEAKVTNLLAVLNSSPVLNQLTMNHVRVEQKLDGTCLLKTTIINKTGYPLSIVDTVLISKSKKDQFPIFINLKLVGSPLVQVRKRLEYTKELPYEYDCKKLIQSKLSLKAIAAYKGNDNALEKNNLFNSRLQEFLKAEQKYNELTSNKIELESFGIKAMQEAYLHNKYIPTFPLLDGSSAERYQDSLKRIEENLTEQEKKDLAFALSLLAVEYLRHDDQNQSAEDAFRKSLHGKDYHQIIDEVNKLMLGRMNTAKEYAKKYYAEAYNKAVGAITKGSPELNNIEIVPSREQQNQSEDITIRARITNNSDRIIDSLMGAAILEINKTPNILMLSWNLPHPLDSNQSIEIESANEISKEIRPILLSLDQNPLIIKPLFVFYEGKLLWANMEFAEHFDTFQIMEQTFNELEKAGSDWKSLYTAENIAKGYFPSEP